MSVPGRDQSYYRYWQCNNSNLQQLPNFRLSMVWNKGDTPDRAFDGVMNGDGGCATNGIATVKYTHPEVITVTKLEMRSYSGLNITLPDGSTTTCPGIGGQEIWSEVEIPNGSFNFTGSNFMSFNYPPGRYLC